MAGFILTNRDILQKNIHYLYFGSPCYMRYRDRGDYPTLDDLRIIREKRNLTEDILKRKSKGYREGLLPDVPAFKVLSKAKLDGMVERLVSPSSCKKSRSEDEESGRSSSGNSRTTRQQQGLVQRLTTSSGYRKTEQNKTARNKTGADWTLKARSQIKQQREE